MTNAFFRTNTKHLIVSMQQLAFGIVFENNSEMCDTNPI